MKWTIRATLGFWTWCLLCLPVAAHSPAWALTVGKEELVRQAQKWEREGAWLAAAELYSELARREPEEATAWRELQRLCLRQDRIQRRYSSPHVRQNLQTMRVASAVELYDEVLTKLQLHAVSDISAEQFFRHGFGNFLLALDQPAYLTLLFPQGIRADILAEYVLVLRPRYERLAVATRKQALRELKTLALTLEQDLGANPAAVVAEFVYAAGETVDEYTEYLPPELVRLMRRAERDDVASVGLGFYVLQGQLWIGSVQSDSPADLAGLRPNDLILAIDGIATQAMTLEEAEWRLLGLEGTSVLLDIAQPAGLPPRRVTLLRQKSPSHSVTGRMLDEAEGLGQIIVGWFQESTPAEFEQVFRALKARGMRGCILDLRGNPGGQFHASLRLAELFVPDGTLATTRGRSPGSSAIHRAEGSVPLDLPLVVLVDQETASAAEVLAAALRDHGRCFLVGQTTFGKGCMQMVFPLGPGFGALRVTTARWYTPKEVHLDGKGLLPDLVIADDPEDEPSSPSLSQKQLDGALRQLRTLLRRAP